MLLTRHQNYIIHPAKTQFDEGVFFVPFLERNDDIWQEETPTATAV